MTQTLCIVATTLRKQPEVAKHSTRICSAAQTRNLKILMGGPASVFDIEHKSVMLISGEGSYITMTRAIFPKRHDDSD